MLEHGGLLALHEPFCNIADYGETTVTGRVVRTADELIATLLALRATTAVFFKDTTDHRHPAVLGDRRFLTEVTHTFLIRSPAEIAASYYAIRPQMSMEEIGMTSLYELYQAARDASGRPPAVIDSADLVANPARTMAAYCEAVGIPFREQALSWRPGPRAAWSRSARWHTAVDSSSTFTPRVSTYAQTVANNARLAEFSAHHEPYYQALRSRRLVIGEGACQ
jgi:adenylylsulfate kinase